MVEIEKLTWCSNGGPGLTTSTERHERKRVLDLCIT